MILNPEFRRNLLLEWSIHRMVLVGGATGGILAVAGVFGTSNIVANVALIVFLFTTVLWGAHRAGDAILDELRERTWDSQRMSAIDPWAMLWGKLFGASVMPWFAGAITLIVYYFERQGPSVGERLQMISFCIAGAILVHALSLIGALVGTHLDKFGKSTLTSWASVGAMALLATYFSNYFDADQSIVWYGVVYDRFDFLTISVFALAVWITFGAYRLMCSELAVATFPWAWVGFQLFLVIYFSGRYLSPTWPLARSLSVVAAVGLATCAFSSYVAAFALYRDPLAFRRLRTYLTQRSGSRFFENLPLWVVSMSLAAIFVIACVALHFTPFYFEHWHEHIGLSALVLWLLPVRDILILYVFTYGESKRRVETSAIICLALLYWVLPSIIESTGLVKTSWLLRPPMMERPLLSASIVAAQLAIVGVLCAIRYRQRIEPVVNLN
ncbi:MAG: hypothetical protein ACI9BW_000416 [Gammaproteobacteria bacterium]|jgi:hypothetical protein